MSLRNKTLITIACLSVLLVLIHMLLWHLPLSAGAAFWLTSLFPGLFFGLSVVLLLKRTVLAQLNNLNLDIQSISQSDDISRRLSTQGGSAELSALATNFNRLLSRQEQLHHSVSEREARLRLVTDNMLDIICQVDRQGNISYVSPSCRLILGFEPKELQGRPIFGLVHSCDQGQVRKAVNKAVETLTAQRTEFRCRHANGKYVWLEAVGKVLLDKNMGFTGGVISCRDITERIAMEKRLRYLSLHDSLTGLYNRTYFEQEMQRLKASRLGRAGLVICDVDGLKLYNDSFGHETGDRLLKLTAQVLKKSFREGDVLARIGGDEFAVLLPGAGPEAVQAAADRVRQHMAEYNESNGEFSLSISIGTAVSEDLEKIAELFREADDNMYREKLHRSKSTRSAIVKVLLKTLEARDFTSEEHANQMQELVVKLAQSIGLPEHRIADLRLFTQFHDVGKVGIPDYILLKKDPLTSEETEKMQAHSEIGSRIARSAPELAHIADWILKHHEWWNGKGYPLGLSGADIPLECRLLAIVDAYDTMTRGRPYRQPVSHGEAIAELKRCAGNQFDPDLTAAFIELLAAPSRKLAV